MKTVGRILLVTLIALSVAALPAKLGAMPAAPASKAADGMPMAMEDCCPKPDKPCDTAPADCAFMAFCTLKGASYPAGALASPALLVAGAAMLLPPTTPIPPSRAGGPPLRPPQS